MYQREQGTQSDRILQLVSFNGKPAGEFLITEILYSGEMLPFLGVWSDSGVSCISGSFCTPAVHEEETSEKALVHPIFNRSNLCTAPVVRFSLECLEPVRFRHVFA